jgi:DNA-binding IclR family transcriptional regulator
MFRIAHLVATRSPIRGFIQPILDDVTRQTGETALFAMYDSALHRTIYLAKADSPDPLRFRISLNQRIDPTRAAAGLAILAQLPAREQAQAIASDVAAAGTPPVSGDVLATRLNRTRVDHYVISQGEESPGLVGIAVPATVPPGTIEGAIALAIPEVRFDRSAVPRYYRIISDAAERLTRFDVSPWENA